MSDKAEDSILDSSVTSPDEKAKSLPLSQKNTDPRLISAPENLDEVEIGWIRSMMQLALQEQAADSPALTEESVSKCIEAVFHPFWNSSRVPEVPIQSPRSGFLYQVGYLKEDCPNAKMAPEGSDDSNNSPPNKWRRTGKGSIKIHSKRLKGCQVYARAELDGEDPVFQFVDANDAIVPVDLVIFNSEDGTFNPELRAYAILTRDGTEAEYVKNWNQQVLIYKIRQYLRHRCGIGAMDDELSFMKLTLVGTALRKYARVQSMTAAMFSVAGSRYKKAGLDLF